MKELTKKILESGLVNVHLAKAMEKWGNLDRGAADLVGTKQVTKETLVAFAEDVGALLEKEHPMRETQLDDPNGREVTFQLANSVTPRWDGVMDEMGRILTKPDISLIVGDVIEYRFVTKHTGPSQLRRVINLEAVFENEKVTATRVFIESP